MRQGDAASWGHPAYSALASPAPRAAHPAQHLRAGRVNSGGGAENRRMLLVAVHTRQ